MHRFNPDMLPDSAFVPGTLEHLVIGNRGRLLDPRRTPVRMVEILPRTGHFVVRIEDFEDTGARWDIPFERVDDYQFERGSALASAADVGRFADVVRRFDRPFCVPCDPECAARTLAMLARVREEAAGWLERHSRFAGRRLDLGSRPGPEEFIADLQNFMAARGVADLEEGFATRYVSNPHSGELVKGHRIVMAELGLVPFEGTVVRDPGLFDAPWSRERRAEHVLSRQAFLRAAFAAAGVPTVTLYRGLSFDGLPEPRQNPTFVSASFDFEVARSCFAPREVSRAGLLMRQVVPVERLFMTYLETASMNRQFPEAEAVLLHESGNPLF